jgi:hypothetical protein
MATNQDQQAPDSEEQQALSIPLFCPNDGTMLEDGERFSYPAWVCPDCTYWKIKL